MNAQFPIYLLYCYFPRDYIPPCYQVFHIEILSIHKIILPFQLKCSMCIKGYSDANVRYFYWNNIDVISDNCATCVQQRHEFQGHIPPPLGSTMMVPPCNNSSVYNHPDSIDPVTNCPPPQSVQIGNVGTFQSTL